MLDSKPTLKDVQAAQISTASNFNAVGKLVYVK